MATVCGERVEVPATMDFSLGNLRKAVKSDLQRMGLNPRFTGSLPTSSMNKLLRFAFLLCLPIGLAADEGIEFFEAKVRPVLVEHCYECHNSSGKAKG